MLRTAEREILTKLLFNPEQHNLYLVALSVLSILGKTIQPLLAQGPFTQLSYGPSKLINLVESHNSFLCSSINVATS